MMKKILFTLLLFTCGVASSQVITFLDIDAKEGLLEQEPSIDLNNDGEISQEEALVVTELDLSVKFIDLFPEIEFFTALEVLRIDRNFLQLLDLSNAPNLYYVDAEVNLLSEVIFYEGTTFYEYLNFRQNTLVQDIELQDNPVTIELFDVGANNVPSFVIGNCPGIETLILSNGKTTNLILDVGTLGNWNFRGCKIESFDFCFVQSTYPDASVELTSQSDLANQPYPVVFHTYNFDLDITFFSQTPVTVQTIESIDCSIADTDSDGQTDENEILCGSDPEDSDSISLDNDNDSFPDCVDFDDDNDGFGDDEDAFPLDDTESVDTDGDGVGNNEDTDDDNDGQLDELEIICGSDPLDDESLSDDINNNNIPDCQDDALSLEDLELVQVKFYYDGVSKILKITNSQTIDATFNLYNLIGQKVIFSNNTEVDLSALPSGIYIAQYGQSVSKVIIN